MGSQKTFTDTEVSDILVRIEHVAAHGGVDAVLTLPNTVRKLIPALAKAARSGAERGTLAALLMDCGFSRATAYRAVRLAFAKAGLTDGGRFQVKVIQNNVRGGLNRHDGLPAKALGRCMVEGMNNKPKSPLRKAYSFRTFQVTEISFYHPLGNYLGQNSPTLFTDKLNM